jgi:hypothetical protein
VTEEPRPSPGKGPPAFRIRGKEVTRVEALSDAVFALALTLLVVSVEAPTTFQKLIEIVKGFPAFAVCFTSLVWIWYRHYQFSRWYGLQDVTTIVVNGILLFLVLFYVYPLKYLYFAFIGQMTGLGGFGPDVGPSEARTLFIVFGAGFSAVFLVFAVLHAHALRVRARLDLNAYEIFETRAEIFDNVWIAVVGTFSIALALALPDRWLQFAGWSYFLVGVAQTLCGMYYGRRRARLFSGA